jgi:hypothetical protein
LFLSWITVLPSAGSMSTSAPGLILN